MINFWCHLQFKTSAPDIQPYTTQNRYNSVICTDIELKFYLIVVESSVECSFPSLTKTTKVICLKLPWKAAGDMEVIIFSFRLVVAIFLFSFWIKSEKKPHNDLLRLSSVSEVFLWQTCFIWEVCSPLEMEALI